MTLENIAYFVLGAGSMLLPGVVIWMMMTNIEKIVTKLQIGSGINRMYQNVLTMLSIKLTAKEPAYSSAKIATEAEQKRYAQNHANFHENVKPMFDTFVEASGILKRRSVGGEEFYFGQAWANRCPGFNHLVQADLGDVEVKVVAGLIHPNADALCIAMRNNDMETAAQILTGEPK